MFNSVALDVVIGLVFIFLLYSLLATVIGEIIAVALNLRARNLKLGVGRMLNDEDDRVSKFDLGKFIKRLFNTLNILNTAKDPKTQKFYNHPEIKYLGSSGLAKYPSSFKAASFSKTIIYYLNDAKPFSEKNVTEMLESEKVKEIFGQETAGYVRSLWEDANKDVTRFKLQLENWFDRTMEQTTEWYKRKIQIVLIVIGFMLAWMFNADSFVIVKKLSIDKKAREQMVTLAGAYIENSRYASDTSRAEKTAADQAKLDTLLAVKKRLDTDIDEAHTLLGMGAWPADSIELVRDSSGKKVMATIPATEVRLLRLSKNDLEKGYVKFTGMDGLWEKLGYFWRLLCEHFWGYAVTAIAISLGAPFWFDMLNKLMQLRTSAKQPATATNNSVPGNTIEPANEQ